MHNCLAIIYVRNLPLSEFLDFLQSAECIAKYFCLAIPVLLVVLYFGIFAS